MIILQIKYENKVVINVRMFVVLASFVKNVIKITGNLFRRNHLVRLEIVIKKN